ncbi:hypothetical protein D3C77_577230 [compost metagenome]
MLQQQLLGVEHALEVGKAFAVLRAGQVQRALRGLRGLVADACALQRTHQPAGGIVGLAGGFAHALVIQLDQLLQAGIFHAHGVLAPAVVERVPDQAGPGGDVEGIGQVIGRDEAPADAAQQAELWIKVGLGHPDQRRLRRHRLLGGTDVRATLQQAGGHALQHGTVRQR